MKRKYIFIPLLAGSVAFTSCKDKSTTTSSENSTGTTDQGENVAPSKNGEVSQVLGGAEDRAAKLGFAKHLPKNIVSYSALFNGRQAFEKLLQTPVGQFAMKRMAEEGLSIDDFAGNEEIMAPLAMYSEEYFTAYGEGSSEVFEVILDLYARGLFYGARTGVFFTDAEISGNPGLESPKVLLDGPLKGMPEEVLALLAKAEIPPVYQGAKVSDSDTRDLLLSNMEGIFDFGEEAIDEGVAENVTIKRGESEFNGFKVYGSKIVELLEKEEDTDLKEIEAIVGADNMAEFKKLLSEKTLVVAVGSVGDYVITFFGKSEEDLVIVEQLEESICANDKLAYLDSYLAKDILGVGFTDDSVVKTYKGISPVIYRMIGAAAQGLEKGLSEASAFGDTSDVEALLGSIFDQGEALSALFDTSDQGYVAYLEDGFKLEGYGGSNMPCLDFGKTHNFSSMEEVEGTLFFANWTSNESYNKKLTEYVSSIGETGYLMAKRAAALEIESNDFAEFQTYLGLFDNSFREDTIGIWQAISIDLSSGLGAESALVIDINGSLPKIPTVPEVVLKEGKIPRIAYVSQVSDREKLQGSWNRVNTSAENILKTVGQMSGNEIPMQVPMSSEKNDLKTWFVPIPFQNDDFVPSVSVSDELFFVSTSKTFSEDLAETVKEGKSNGRNGAWVHIDFKVMNQYAQDWFKLVEDNAKELIASESAHDDFVANKEKVKELLKVAESLEKMTMHTRNEDGQVRTSLHLKAN